MLEELRKLLKHTTVFGAGNILGKVIGLLMIPFYTHYLVPAEYGTLELLDLTVTVVGLLMSVWITSPVLRYYYEYEEEKERHRVVSTALLGTVVLNLPIAAAGYLMAAPLASLVLRSSAQLYYIRIVCLTLVFSALYNVGWTYMRARQKSALVVTLDIATLVLSLSANIYLVAFGHFGVAGMLFGSLVGVSAVSVVVTVKTFREVGFNFDWQKLWKLVRFGLPLLFNSAAAFVLNFSDRFFLQHFSTLANVGIYALGYKFGYMLSFLIVQPFMLIWGARAYEIAKQKRGSEYIGRIVEYFSLVLVAGGLGLSLIIREVITIIAAPPFRSAYHIVPLVAAAYIFQGLALYFQAGLLIQKRTGYVGAIGLACIVVNLALNYSLISRYDQMGAAVATLFTFAFQAAATFVASRRLYPAPYRVLRLLKPIVAAAAVYIVAMWLPITNIGWSLLAKLALFSCFPMLLLALRFFDQQEVQVLGAGIRSVLKGACARLRPEVSVCM